MPVPDYEGQKLLDLLVRKLYMNILCVCPRCHVLLDYGAIRLELATLRKAEGHEVDEAMVEYHNEKLYAKK